MGLRFINTVRSGKYMNPTDQARKEARKQELRKNKKQRNMVRAAVIKGKDPHRILEQLEEIDQMEYNVNQPSPLNDNVLKDKRKKLCETLSRVLSLYEGDSEKWSELKRKQTEYEHKRTQLVLFYESVKREQQVRVDEIPLPGLPQKQGYLIRNPPGPPPIVKVMSDGHYISRAETGNKKQAVTISAEPKIRNLSADVTRFVPSALTVKREHKKNKPNAREVYEWKREETNFHQQTMEKQHEEDDAYKTFMQEMQELM